MSGYPPPAGFNLPPDPPMGYPPQGGMGYPPQPGYPPPGGPMGYPPQGAMGGYPPPGGQPGQMGYPPAGGYPPQGQMGYPPPGGLPGYQPQGQMGYPAPGASAAAAAGPVLGYGLPSMGGASGGAAAAPAMGAFGPSGSFPAATGGATMASVYYSGRPTVFPARNFDPGQDADVLRKAMRGLGTDEERIIAVLSKRTADQRAEIAKKYKASFGKDLEKSLKSELSGKFEDLVLMSIETLPGMLATSMYGAMKGAGTNEKLLIQALIPYPNVIIREISTAYKTKYGRDLTADIRSDTSGDFEKILVALAQGQREENMPVDQARAAADAEALYNAGEKRLGTEEAVFTRILSQRSFEQIRAICAAYQQKYGRSLEKAILKETSGYYETTLVSIVRYAEDKNNLLATWFYEAMAGAGTRDSCLIQLTLGRCEIDMQDIKDAYQRSYKKTLAKAIEGDTSGDYKKMLVALVGQ